MDLKVSATDCNMEVIAKIYFYLPHYTGLSFYPVVEQLTSAKPQVIYSFILICRHLLFAGRGAISLTVALTPGKPHTVHKDPQRQVLYPGDLLSAGSFLQRGSSLSHFQLKVCWWESSAACEIWRTENNSPLKKGAVWVLLFITCSDIPHDWHCNFLTSVSKFRSRNLFWT